MQPEGGFLSRVFLRRPDRLLVADLFEFVLQEPREDLVTNSSNVPN